MAGAGKVAIVVGAYREVGKSIGKEIARRVPQAKIQYITEGQDNLQVFNEMELKESRGPVIREEFSKLMEVIKHQHKTVDILVNNASNYKPTALAGFEADRNHDHPVHLYHSKCVPESNPAYVTEAKRCIRTNYTFFKEVLNNFVPIMGKNSRIVNVGSHLGLLRNIPSPHLREAFAQPDMTEKHLDDLIDYFLLEVERGTHEAEGWPSCADTVSKVAVNSYTEILQRRLETEMPDRGIAVNCVESSSNAAEAVAYIATHGMPKVKMIPPKVGEVAMDQMPRGKILGSNLQEVDWCAEKISLATRSSAN